jgi:hypothetical protein
VTHGASVDRSAAAIIDGHMPNLRIPLRGLRAPVRDAGPRRRGAGVPDLRQPDAGARILDVRGEHRRRERDASASPAPCGSCGDPRGAGSCSMN